jgi:hypothetical protein
MGRLELNLDDIVFDRLLQVALGGLGRWSLFLCEEAAD